LIFVVLAVVFCIIVFFVLPETITASLEHSIGALLLYLGCGNPNYMTVFSLLGFDSDSEEG